MNKFYVYQQIAYIPRHAKGDINHQDVEFGFITKVLSGGACFCRYFTRGSDTELRTTSCSELTPNSLLRPYISRDPGIISEKILEISGGR